MSDGGQPIVETVSGRVRGADRAGIAIFTGIPYGADTTGKNRFQPPLPVTPWSGVRDALSYGPQAPQWRALPHVRPTFEEVLGPATELREGEDCLRLNVWTPELEPGAKLPVMVWLHGGGFAAHSANWAVYDGGNLARRGNVVVVSANHRLNLLGFFMLSDLGGERYAHSANAGLLDLVAVLRWVRENIGQFGGDPANVTIFGQSGGGSKVSALMSMPAARGLFHRAIIQSGPAIRFTTSERGDALAEAALRELEISKRNLDRLHDLPLERLLAAIVPATRAVSRPRYPLLDRYDFGPVVDGVDLPAHPVDSVADLSADVPLLIGGTSDESTLYLMEEDAVWNRIVTEQELRARIAALADGEAEAVLDLYRGADPTERLIEIVTGSSFWIRSVLFAERMTALGRAPVHMYSFDWPSPILNGRLRAHHMVEVPFAFDNTDIAASTAGAAGARELATVVAESWLAFARTGLPGTALLPDWPGYREDRRSVMILGTHRRLVTDPDRAARLLWSRVAWADGETAEITEPSRA